MNKTLEDALTEHMGDYVYIGSATGYFYIGEVDEDTSETIDAISQWYYNELLRSLVRANERERIAKCAVTLLRALKKRYPENKDIAEEFNIAKKESAATARSKANLIDQYKEYTPLKTRSVREEYRRNAVEPYGDVIVIDGLEDGFAWFDYEYNAKIQKIRRKVTA